MGILLFLNLFIWRIDLLLVEVLVPDNGRRLFVSVEENTHIEAILRRICKVVEPRGISAMNEYGFMNVDVMRAISIDMTVKEAGLVNGSRLLLVREESMIRNVL